MSLVNLGSCSTGCANWPSGDINEGGGPLTVRMIVTTLRDNPVHDNERNVSIIRMLRGDPTLANGRPVSTRHGVGPIRTLLNFNCVLNTVQSSRNVGPVLDDILVKSSTGAFGHKYST